MNYPEYRRQGLPITSSHIESTIKQVNKRVKGSEKFWDRAAEAILHLAADHIGSHQFLDRFCDSKDATDRLTAKDVVNQLGVTIKFNGFILAMTSLDDLHQ